MIGSLVSYFLFIVVCLFYAMSSFKLTGNGLRAGDRNPVLRLRQGYGACTLL
jgi:hypothetical protein